MHSAINIESLLIANCLEICKSVNIVLIIYSLHGRTILLHFNPLVTSLYSLLAVITCIGVPSLYAVFLTF